MAWLRSNASAGCTVASTFQSRGLPEEVIEVGHDAAPLSWQTIEHGASMSLVLFRVNAEQYAQSWQRARRPDEVLERPNFYVHAPCRTDPTAAPEGCDSIMVLFPVANIQETGSGASMLCRCHMSCAQQQ